MAFSKSVEERWGCRRERKARWIQRGGLIEKSKGVWVQCSGQEDGKEEKKLGPGELTGRDGRICGLGAWYGWDLPSWRWSVGPVPALAAIFSSQRPGRAIIFGYQGGPRRCRTSRGHLKNFRRQEKCQKRNSAPGMLWVCLSRGGADRTVPGTGKSQSATTTLPQLPRATGYSSSIRGAELTRISNTDGGEGARPSWSGLV